MYKVRRPCRVCGQMFTPCSDCDNDKNAFHWRSVACSPECAREYFRRVKEERAKDRMKCNVEANKANVNSVEDKKIEVPNKRSGKSTKQKNNIESE